MSNQRNALYSLINDLQTVTSGFVIQPDHEVVLSVNYTDGSDIQYKASIIQLQAALLSAAPPIALDDLTDVVISLPSINQTLVFNGTNWINQNVLPSEKFQVLPYVAPIANVISFALTVPATALYYNMAKLFINGQKIAFGTGFNFSSATTLAYNDLYLGAPLDNLDTIEVYYY